MNRLLSTSGSAAPSTTAVAEMANREAQIAAASAASALNTETRTYLEHTRTMHRCHDGAMRVWRFSRWLSVLLQQPAEA